jgi:predicted transcriptional regulator
MATRKRTISVRLDDRAKRRVEMAAKLLKQSSGAFLEKAGEERARQLLLDWAVSRHQRGEASFSELAEETGLSVEEIMEAGGSQGKEEALQMFLASCRTVAETQGNPEFLRLGREAVEAISSRMVS